MSKKHTKSSSTEDYLETIYILKLKQNNIRAIDLSNALGYSRASVSNALKKMRELDLLEVSDKGYIYFLDKGLNIAERVYRKHKLLTNFFTLIGVDEEQAEIDACKIEHYISKEIAEKLSDFYEKIKEEY